MIQSMTGYGKAAAEIGDKKISIEIKSLNSKQCDLFARVSPVYREKELDLRSEIMQQLGRGKIEFTLNVDNAGKNSAGLLNITFVESYYRQIVELSEKLQIPIPSDWFSALLRQSDAFQTAETQGIGEEEWLTLKTVLKEALLQLTEFRRQEGKALQQVLEEKINNIQTLSESINQYENERIEKVKLRLHENLLALSEKVDYDRNRFEQELIFYIEKLDVNEEKVRLKNHLQYFLQTMNSEEFAGKKLGFIAQEIGREINTLGSKSNHSEMQKLVVLMKDELEQIKEQVLNVL